LAHDGIPMNPGLLYLWNDQSFCGSFDDDGNAYFVGWTLTGAQEYVLFRAGDGGLEKLVGGCVSYGPCGDPTPVGGTFGDLYWGTAEHFTPDVNAAGDVLFKANVAIGSIMYGLFLRHPSGAIEKVVTFGDPNPLGGTFVGLRNAALAENGDVVFVGAG